MTQPIRRATPELNALIDLFYAEAETLGVFSEVTESELPTDARRLLAHDEHMTVTVEAFHGCPVALAVLRLNMTETHYAREILLLRERDGQVVQYGIVRLALSLLDAEVRREIEEQGTPLGRVLIEHNVLRNVRLLSLWRVEPGPELCRHFKLEHSKVCFGRTALIYCDGVPAVELLEIVTPG
jgi:chorismate-pyruvate lyase